MKNIWAQQKKHFLVLAPMAGYTDSSFRLVCREFGADVVMTELVSADALAYNKFTVQQLEKSISGKDLAFNQVSSSKHNTTTELISFFDSERPLIVQLFGKNPENFAKAARWISDVLKPDGIDINMGCPARKVVGSDHGSALLKNTELAVEIVKAVKANCDLPVSVKTRLGWDNDDQILSFGPALIDAGIQALIVHGRTYQDKFKGEARWGNIIKLKQIVGDKAVVVGNGDIHALEDIAVLDPVGALDGHAIGRSSFGHPWIFKGEKLGPEERLETIVRHANLTEATLGAHGMIEFRKHLLAYLRGFDGAKELRIEAVGIETAEDVSRIVEKARPKVILNHTAY